MIEASFEANDQLFFEEGGDSVSSSYVIFHQHFHSLQYLCSILSTISFLLTIRLPGGKYMDPQKLISKNTHFAHLLADF